MATSGLEGSLGGRFFSRLHRLLNECVDRHWTDAAGNRCDGARSLEQWLQLNVTDSAGVITGIDDHCAVFNPICPNELGSAHCANNQVRLAHMALEIASTLVADGDRSIGFEEHHCHRLAEDRAPPDHDGVESRQRDLVVF